MRLCACIIFLINVNAVKVNKIEQTFATKIKDPKGTQGHHTTPEPICCLFISVS
jgi:hypothetical protein